MKQISFKRMMTLLWAMLLASSFLFVGCNKDDDDDDDPVIVLDGFYVKGDAVVSNDFVDKARMKVTNNEVNQTERASLYELYIPVKATGGFNIVQVAGSTRKTWGPGADFGEITNPTNDEPKLAKFWRGSLAETSTKFTVPEDGMYHVIIDTEVGKVVVARVHWGVIGAATPDGWGASTQMTESAFNQNTMTWTLTDMELRGGDWKFRYSGGWKIELDTTLDIGGGNIGVKVNTNFGGAINALVPGGANIVNSAPGVYNITLTYTLGTGYVATATKTADLPMTNWTGVQCDAVGSGVSADNANAIPDPSSWGWGNQLLADNGAVPTVANNVYTWTWTAIILEANEGFKLRTLNGVAPPVGGANFDVGYSAVNVAASTNKVADSGGNLTVTEKKAYNITLKIDAANSDAKEIIITE